MESGGAASPFFETERAAGGRYGACKAPPDPLFFQKTFPRNSGLLALDRERWYTGTNENEKEREYGIL